MILELVCRNGLIQCSDEKTQAEIDKVPFGGVIHVEYKKPTNTRTGQQRKAIEVYCKELASALNEAGYPLTKFPFSEGVEIMWNQMRIKEELWRPVQIAMLNKESTTKLSTKEVNEVYEILSKKVSEATGVYLRFPSLHQPHI